MNAHLKITANDPSLDPPRKGPAWAGLMDQPGATPSVLETWRTSRWPLIKRDLRVHFKLEPVEEPIWVSPGVAVYWHKQTRMTAVAEKRAHLEPVETTWERAGALPADSASTIAYYLQKRGFRLHPEGPVDVGSVMVDQKVPGEGTGLFGCKRHDKGFAFTSFKAYLRHCENFNESPEHRPEPGQGHRYYCDTHGVGFWTKRQAQYHIRACNTRLNIVRGFISAVPHKSVDAMLVTG